MVDIQAENQKCRQKLGNRGEPTYKLEAQAAQGVPGPDAHTDADHPQFSHEKEAEKLVWMGNRGSKRDSLAGEERR